MPLLSIVIPVYNVENYLEECLKSILNQKFNNYEVILVDDASTDKSGYICDKYASKNKSIKVIHLEKNSLPGSARNIGLKHAAGEYVHFCDSDDYYVEDCFYSISEVLKKDSPEVLVGNFISRPEEGAFFCSDFQFNMVTFNNMTSDDVLKYFLQFPKLGSTTCRFISKRSFLIKNHITFPEGCYFEDEGWYAEVTCCSNKFSLLSKPFYCYRPRAVGSILSKKTYFHSKSQIKVVISLLNFLRERKITGVRKEYIISRVKFLLGLFATRCDTFDRNQLIELSSIIENEMDSFKMLEKTSETGDIFDFVNKYGSYIGLWLYRTYVIEKTLELVQGKQDKDIYIFPTGYNGEGTARILKNNGYKVKGFFDNSNEKNGCTIDGLKVNLPSIIKEYNSEELDNIFVLIATQKEDVKDILKEQLRRLGLVDSQFASRIY